MPTATSSPSAITATARRNKIVATKAKTKDEQIGARVGKLLARRPTENQAVATTLKFKKLNETRSQSGFRRFWRGESAI